MSHIYLASLVVQWWRIHLSMLETFDPWVGKIPWGRKWQPTPVFLPGKSREQWSLSGYSLWVLKRVGHSLSNSICVCVYNSSPLWFLNKCLFIYLWLFWASLVAQLVKNLPAMQETWVGNIPWRRERLPTPAFWPGESHVLCSPWGGKESDTAEWLSLSWLCWSLLPHEGFL